MTSLAGKAHRPELDNLSAAQQRVVLEQLLYTMEVEQRTKLMQTFPGLYRMIYPGTEQRLAEIFAADCGVENM